MEPEEQQTGPESESTQPINEKVLPRIIWLNARRKVNDLKFHPENPRIITNEDVEIMEKGMDEFGYFDPVAVNLDNVIISGHKRVMALLDKGVDEEIDVRIPNRLLTDEEHKKLMVLANKLGSNNKHWDWDKLLNNFDEEILKDVGFTQSELDGYITEAEKEAAEIEKETDDIDFRNFEDEEDDQEPKSSGPKIPKKVVCPECGHEFTI